MPRETKRATTRRSFAGGQNAVQAPSVTTEVVARHVDTYSKPAQKTNQLLESLKAVQPSLQNYLDRQDKRAEQEGTIAAQQMSLEEANKMVRDGHWLREQNPFFQRAYMAMHGQKSARSAVADLMNQYTNGFNPDTDNIDQFFNDFHAKDLAGLEDQDFMAGYTPIMENAKQHLRDQYNKYHTEKIATEVNDGIFQNFQDAIQGALDEGRGLSSLELSILKSDAVDFFGKTPKEVEEIAFNAAHSLGIMGQPKAYDVFFEKRQDGTPGLAHTQQWAEKITKSRMSAQHAFDTEKKKIDESKQFDVLNSINEKALKGELTQQDIKTHVDSGMITAETGMSYYNKSEVERKKIEEHRQIVNAIREGKAIQIADESKVKKAFDDVGDEILKEAAATQDSAMMNKAIQRVVTLGKTNGQFYGKWKNQLELATPENPQAFISSAELYRNIKAANPAYAESILPEDKAMVYQAYWDMQALEGMTQEEALANTQQMVSPDNITAVRSFLNGKAGAELADRVQSQLVNYRWDNYFFDKEPVNHTYLNQQVKRLATLRMAHGHTSAEKAVDWAVERVKATHRVIKDRAVYVGNKPLYDGFEKDVELYLEDFAARRQKEGLDTDPGGYYVVPDSRTLTDGTWGVYGEDGQFFSGVRVSVDGLRKNVGKIRTEKKKQEVLKAQQQEMENLKNHDVISDMVP